MDLSRIDIFERVRTEHGGPEGGTGLRENAAVARIDQGSAHFVTTDEMPE